MVNFLETERLRGPAQMPVFWACAPQDGVGEASQGLPFQSQSRITSFQTLKSCESISPAAPSMTIRPPS